MTLYQTLPGGVLVFRGFQDHRLLPDAEQFLDRPRPVRRDPAANAVCAGRPAVDGDVVRVAAICAYSPLANFLLYPLESRFPKWDSSRGDLVAYRARRAARRHLSTAHGVPVIQAAADRLISAATLGRRYPKAHSTPPAAARTDFQRRQRADATALFQGLGIPKSRLTMERQSPKRTPVYQAGCHAEARQRWLLVTSAYTALGRTFRKAGFAVEPIGGLEGRHHGPLHQILSRGQWPALSRRYRRARMAGLITYRISGSTDALLPARNSPSPRRTNRARIEAADPSGKTPATTIAPETSTLPAWWPISTAG
jgi:uncharacterized SAM-binding protein YcdF (DUF218 family)